MISHVVLNPSIRMSWIQRHWGQDYISDAEAKIRETVSPNLGLGALLIWIVLKMLEYREITLNTGEGQPTAVSLAAAPQYMSLAKQYGIGDEMEIGDPGSGTGDQTIEHEYRSYIIATLSPQNIDIVKFWEVSLDS